MGEKIKSCQDAAILIIDDDASIRETLNSVLKSKYKIFLAETGSEGLKILRSQNIDIVFLDLKLPDTNGLRLLEIMKKYFPFVDIIIITIVSEVATVVQAIKGGAFDYVNKDLDPTKILHLVEIVKDKRRKENELLYLRDELSLYTDKELLFGKTSKMQKIKALINKIKDLPTIVLIQGETGTGKELIAREIHKSSRYKHSPFVSVNLSALPKELIESTLFGHEKGAFTGAINQSIGKFELANSGILFLDEIGELEYSLQAKLLRVIQEEEIERVGSNKPIKLNVRLIAATSRNLEKMIEDGAFRKELYFRLNVIPVKLPPLRERIADLEALSNLFIGRYSRKFGKKIERMSADAMSCLKSYGWPGNIRELENLIERTVAITDKTVIEECDIPFEYFLNSINQKVREGNNLKRKRFLKETVETFERSMIVKCLETNHFDKQKTALMLGIPLSTLKFKLKKLGIDSKDSIGQKTAPAEKTI